MGSGHQLPSGRQDPGSHGESFGRIVERDSSRSEIRDLARLVGHGQLSAIHPQARTTVANASSHGSAATPAGRISSTLRGSGSTGDFTMRDPRSQPKAET